jgi:hypothetical protein
MMKKIPPKEYIFLLLTLSGITLRLCWAMFVPTVQLYDFETFLDTASNIYNGLGHTLNGNPVAWVGPLYPYALAFFHRLMGSDNASNALILNVILSSMTLIASRFIYFKLFGGRLKPTIAAYGITAVFPNLIAYCNVAGTETFFLFLLSLILLIQLYTPDKYRYAQAAALGVMCALAALTKPFMLAYPAVILIIWLSQRHGIKRTLINLGILTASMVIVIAPWTYRNYRAFGRLIIISYNMGYNQMVNNNDLNHTGGWMPLEDVPMSEGLRELVDGSLAGGRSVKEAHELEPHLSKEASAWIFKNPVAFFELGALRFQRTFFNGAGDIGMWAMNDWQPQNMDDPNAARRHIAFAESTFSLIINAVSAAALFFFAANLTPFVKSAYNYIRRREITVPPPVLLVFMNISFFYFVVFMFEGQERYSHPALLFFVFAVVWVFGKLGKTDDI